MKGTALVAYGEVTLDSKNIYVHILFSGNSTYSRWKKKSLLGYPFFQPSLKCILLPVLKGKKLV